MMTTRCGSPYKPQGSIIKWVIRVTKALYLEDSYLRRCDATVASIKDGKYVILDQTIFYPKGGGQPWDTGKIMKGNDQLRLRRNASYFLTKLRRYIVFKINIFRLQFSQFFYEEKSLFFCYYTSASLLLFSQSKDYR